MRTGRTVTPAALKAARQTLNLTQQQLAEVLGIHVTIVNRWENGHSKIPPYLHLAIECLFRVSRSRWQPAGKPSFRPLSQRTEQKPVSQGRILQPRFSRPQHVL